MTVFYGYVRKATPRSELHRGTETFDDETSRRII